MSRSAGHRGLTLADLEWAVMPPLLLGQYKIYRDGDRPLGVAVWAFVSPADHSRLLRGPVRLLPTGWRHGAPPLPDPAATTTPPAAEAEVWLLDFITSEPSIAVAERVVADLRSTALAGRRLNLFLTDPTTGRLGARTLPA